MSVNYSGGTPTNFDGTSRWFHNRFPMSWLTEEVKIATVRIGNNGGFNPGNCLWSGIDGEVVRIAPSGHPITNPWVSLPGNSNGLMRVLLCR